MLALLVRIAAEAVHEIRAFTSPNFRVLKFLDVIPFAVRFRPDLIVVLGNLSNRVARCSNLYAQLFAGLEEHSHVKLNSLILWGVDLLSSSSILL